MINHKKKMEELESIFKYCLDVAGNKGHDYSGEEDAMSNFHDFGWKGVVVRLGDKYHRLKNFAKQGTLKVQDESIRDTLHDMINYAALALIEMDIEEGKHTHLICNCVDKDPKTRLEGLCK